MLVVKDRLMRINSSAILLWGGVVAMLCGSAAQAQEVPERLRPADAQSSADESGPASDDGADTSQPFSPQTAKAPSGMTRLDSTPTAGPPPGNVNPYGYGDPGNPGAAYGYPAGADPRAMSAWPGVSPYDHMY